MNENEKNLTTEETEENDYIQAINELKANTVDKSQYEKLKAEKGEENPEIQEWIKLRNYLKVDIVK